MACARTTNSVVYLMPKQCHSLFCHLDDFGGIAPSRSLAQAAYDDLIKLTNQLGLDRATHKCCPPDTGAHMARLQSLNH